MRILVDTNIVLDVLLNRTPFVEASAAACSLIESQSHEGLLAAHAVTTIAYLTGKYSGSAASKRTVASLLQIFGVAPVDSTVLQDALASPQSDFEDSVTASAARLSRCDFIVTRDPKGFRGSHVPSLSPEAFIALIASIH